MKLWRTLRARFVVVRHPFAAFWSFDGRMKDIEQLARSALKVGLTIHRDLGPGLLESAYEAVMAELLARERQKPIPLVYAGIRLEDAFKADLLVEGKLLIELKSVERVAPVHPKQVLTYLTLLNLPLGLLLNFGAATFKEGAERVINVRADLSSIHVWQQPDGRAP
jgi:iron complex transport system substrate-binding protein